MKYALLIIMWLKSVKLVLRLDSSAEQNKNGIIKMTYYYLLSGGTVYPLLLVNSFVVFSKASLSSVGGDIGTNNAWSITPSDIGI